MTHRWRIVVTATLASLVQVSTAVAADPIAQFHLSARDVFTTRFTMKAGKVYPMEVSGTRKKDLGVGSSFESHLFEDAFYCYQSDEESCPPKASAPSHSAPITARTGEQSTLHPLHEFVADGEPVPNMPQWHRPAFRADHAYTFGFRPKLNGTLVLATTESCGPPIRCSGDGFDVKIFEPEDAPDPCAGASRVHAAAVNEVPAVAVQQDDQVHKAGTPEDAWVPLCKDTVLQQGDEISCDPDGAVTLQFADNSTVVVRNTTQLKIASFFTEGGVVKTEILLKMGEVAAKVHKSEATRSDFRIKSPTSVASVRGTDFTVSYDPGSKATITTVREGVVEVDPEAPNLETVSLTAGREIEVGVTTATRPAAIGKAGARGGNNRRAALVRVLKVVARADACGVRTPRLNAYAVKPIRGGWGVALKLEGDRRGTSRWTVKRSKVKATNALAKKVAKRCS